MTKLRLFKYACLLVIVTAVFGTIYATAQQNYRQSANDPQIQIAEDAVVALDKGAMPQWNATNQIDADASLSPFVLLYNASGTLVEASGLINGAMPAFPAGVLAYAKAHGEDDVTWQTQASSTILRFAAVVLPYGNGYVVAARSLREVEKREAALNVLVGVPWAVSILLMLIYCVWKWKETKKVQ